MQIHWRKRNPAYSSCKCLNMFIDRSRNYWRTTVTKYSRRLVLQNIFFERWSELLGITLLNQDLPLIFKIFCIFPHSSTIIVVLRCLYWFTDRILKEHWNSRISIQVGTLKRREACKKSLLNWHCFIYCLCLQ